MIQLFLILRWFTTTTTNAKSNNLTIAFISPRGWLAAVVPPRGWPAAVVLPDGWLVSSFQHWGKWGWYSAEAPLVMTWAQTSFQKSVFILMETTCLHGASRGPRCSFEDCHTKTSSFLARVLLTQPWKIVGKYMVWYLRRPLRVLFL